MEARTPEPVGPPVGRVMQFQAPLVGERLHRLASRLPVYRQATALAGGGLIDELAEIVLPPLLVGVMAADERARELLAPLFVGVMRSAAVALVKAQREQEATMEEIAEFDAEAQELIGAMLDSLFAPRPTSGGETGGHDGG